MNHDDNENGGFSTQNFPSAEDAFGSSSPNLRQNDEDDVPF